MNPFHHRMTCLTLVVLLFVFQSALRAEEDPQELSGVRQAYGKEIEFATHSIREKYLTKLDALKRSLGARGDIRGALAVEKEIENIKAGAPDAVGAEKFAGVWKVRYGNGVVRRYVINGDGNVTFDEENGHSFPPKKGKITLRKSQYFIEFQSGEFEKLGINGNALSTELFNGKDALASGIPQFQGNGTKDQKEK